MPSPGPAKYKPRARVWVFGGEPRQDRGARYEGDGSRRTHARSAKRLADRHSNVLDHLVLAELIECGDYDRHVRRARLRYRRRRDELTRALARCRPPRQAAGDAAGLHALVTLPEGTHDALGRLERAGVAVNEMSRYTGAPDSSALVIGYATPPGHAWPGALTALGTALDS